MQLFDSHVEAGQTLSKKEREAYYAALIEFAYYGTEPVGLKGAPLAIFTAIKPTLELSRVRSAARKKGGKNDANKRGTNGKQKSKQNGIK